MLKHFKVVTPAIPAAELDKFRSYVKSFYSTDGMAVYPIADSATLDAAIDAYIANIGDSEVRRCEEAGEQCAVVRLNGTNSGLGRKLQGDVVRDVCAHESGAPHSLHLL